MLLGSGFRPPNYSSSPTHYPLLFFLFYLMEPSNNKHGMEIFHTYKKLRYFLNPNSLYSLFFTSQFSSSSSITLVSTINPTSFLSSTQNPKPHISQLCYTTSSSGSFQLKSKFSGRNFKNKRDNLENVEEIVKVVKLDKVDMEIELNKMGLILSLDLISEVFRGLNADEVSGFRFFNWVREKGVSFYRNSDFCSLAIDNLGRVEDYTLMLVLLKEFTKETLCLTEKAFEFLPVINLNHDLPLVREYVMKVLNMLNKVGGSSRNSGIFALIKMLCSLKLFDLAMFVMEETARKTSYYNVLIWAKCRTCDFKEAYDLLDEMRRIGCDPNANSYNYLLGSLCKHSKTAETRELFARMEEFGYSPDAVTFEVIIYHACRLRRLDFAVEFLHQMISRGIEPRHTTHAAILKGYFFIDRSQEAYMYVVDMCEKCKCSANMNYSLLASLLHRSGRVVEARAILVDMIDKGLKPNFPVYIKVMKDLHKSSMGYLVADLKSRFSKFDSNTKDL